MTYDGQRVQNYLAEMPVRAPLNHGWAILDMFNTLRNPILLRYKTRT